MTVEKPTTKYLARPITTGAISAMNQSEFLAITCNLLKAREKSRMQGGIDLGGFCFSLVKKLARDFLSKSISEVLKNALSLYGKQI